MTKKFITIRFNLISLVIKMRILFKINPRIINKMGMIHAMRKGKQKTLIHSYSIYMMIRYQKCLDTILILDLRMLQKLNIQRKVCAVLVMATCIFVINAILLKKVILISANAMKNQMNLRRMMNFHSQDVIIFQSKRLKFFKLNFFDNI